MTDIPFPRSASASGGRPHDIAAPRCARASPPAIAISTRRRGLRQRGRCRRGHPLLRRRPQGYLRHHQALKHRPGLRFHALKAFEGSLKKLGTDYVDLYLIHWPSPHTWLYRRNLEGLRASSKEEGRARSIGVSNFYPEHLEHDHRDTGVVPVINQIELHPDFQQKAAQEAHKKLNIVTQSWSPLGQGKLIADPTIGDIAEKHGKTPAQVIIRWHIDSGLVVIPKSVTPSRIEENFKVFDFKLDATDMAAIAKLDDKGARMGPDPYTANF